MRTTTTTHGSAVVCDLLSSVRLILPLQNLYSLWYDHGLILTCCGDDLLRENNDNNGFAQRVDNCS